MRKNILMVLSFVCIALVLLKPAGMADAVNSTVADDLEKKEVSFSKYEQHPAILCEPTTVGFSARIVSSSNNQKTKIFERLLKNSFSIGKNFCLELSIENYIFFVRSSPHYISNLNELRRLNI